MSFGGGGGGGGNFPVSYWAFSIKKEDITIHALSHRFHGKPLHNQTYKCMPTMGCGCACVTLATLVIIINSCELLA